MAADEMLQLGVNIVELDAEFADQVYELLIALTGEGFGSGHVEEWT